ncbi:MAG: HNH endonuclease [Bacteroidales bacterium]|nr:HNH endonuclease [Bacteroidales bacterium]
MSNYSDEELFENILNIWQHKGKQPTRRDLNSEPSKISQSPYNRRFSSWSTAIKKFIEYANENDIKSIKSESADTSTKKTSRDPSLRLRFKVLKRDNFSCVQCGASPAKNPAVVLHIDHIKPWSKDGETEISNLQTLCQNCNLGKSNLE